MVHRHEKQSSKIHKNKQTCTHLLIATKTSKYTQKTHRKVHIHSYTHTHTHNHSLTHTHTHIHSLKGTGTHKHTQKTHTKHTQKQSKR